MENVVRGSQAAPHDQYLLEEILQCSGKCGRCQGSGSRSGEKGTDLAYILMVASTRLGDRWHVGDESLRFLA